MLQTKPQNHKDCIEHSKHKLISVIFTITEWIYGGLTIISLIP